MDLTRFITLFILLTLPSACIAAPKSETPESPTRTLEAPTETPSEIGDGGLISGEPCGPPCLFGIIPGVSTEDEAINSLRQEDFSYDCDFGAVAITCSIVTVGFRDNVVTYVNYFPSGVLVSDLFAEYGPPDGWDLACSQDEVANIICPPLWLELKYVDEHMVIFLESQQTEDFYILAASSRVNSVVYYADFFILDTYYIPWHGYGEYRNP